MCYLFILKRSEQKLGSENMKLFSIMKFFLACTDTVLCVIVSHHILPYVGDNVLYIQPVVKRIYSAIWEFTSLFYRA